MSISFVETECNAQRDSGQALCNACRNIFFDTSRIACQIRGVMKRRSGAIPVQAKPQAWG